MIYAIFGIPLVLTVLDNLGKLLTRLLKSPWFLLKCGWRRLSRYCTKQSMKEIHRLDAEDRKELAKIDLPVSIAVFVVIAWILLCSATFCLWENDWDFFTAFYFFFISLSTIGLGDITPNQPKYLLMLFVYIIVGLSLVSMCVNLIQIKYLPQSLSIDDVMKLVDTEEGDILLLSDMMKRDESSGILSSETDCASTTSEFTTSTSGDSQPIVPSKSFDNGFPTRQFLTHTALTFPTTVLASILTGSTSKNQFCSSSASQLGLLPTLTDLELIEELEDRMLLSSSGSFEINPSVHFRSRLSLIPEQLEQHSGVEEEEDEKFAQSSSSSSFSSGPLASPLDENGNTSTTVAAGSNRVLQRSVPASSSRSSLSSMLGNFISSTLGSAGIATKETKHRLVNQQP